MWIHNSNHGHDGYCNGSVVRTEVFVSVILLLCSSLTVAQPHERRELSFQIKPTKPAFGVNEDITIEFSLKNTSTRRVLATREASLHDLIYLEILDERGERIPWRGKIVSRGYPSGFFVVLEPNQSTTFRSVISHSGVSGYQFHGVGAYRIRAHFSLAPNGYFLPVAKGAVVEDKPVKSNWTQFSLVTSDSK